MTGKFRLNFSSLRKKRKKKKRNVKEEERMYQFRTDLHRNKKTYYEMMNNER